MNMSGECAGEVFRLKGEHAAAIFSKQGSAGCLRVSLANMEGASFIKAALTPHCCCSSSGPRS